MGGKLNVLASEEEDDPVPHSDIVVDEASKFVAVFDPSDGSSNVDATIPTGTIFGIFRSDSNECAIDPDLSLTQQKEQCLVQTLQPGTNLVCAGYCLYSSSTHFVFTYGDGVNGFTLDPVMGEFILTHLIYVSHQEEKFIHSMKQIDGIGTYLYKNMLPRSKMEKEKVE